MCGYPVDLTRKGYWGNIYWDRLEEMYNWSDGAVERYSEVKKGIQPMRHGVSACNLTCGLWRIRYHVTRKSIIGIEF